MTKFIKVRRHTVIVVLNCKCCREKSIILDVHCLQNTFYFALFIIFNNFFRTDTDWVIELALETIFQLGKLMHTFAYHLLQNLNSLNCIRRFVCLNESSNSTKFVLAQLDRHKGNYQNNKHFLNCFIYENFKNSNYF